MQQAKYIKDDRYIDAENFLNWSEATRASLNGELVCPGCNQPVIFRNGVPGARRPCFCAYPHMDGCSYATSNHEDNMGNGRSNSHSLLLGDPDMTLVVNLPRRNQRSRSPVINHGGSWLEDEIEQSYSDSRRYSIHVLNSYLKSLMNSRELLESEREMRVPYEGNFRCSSFFVHCHDVNGYTPDTLLGFWGRIHCVNNIQGSGLWINFGAFQNFSILISEEKLADLKSFLRPMDFYSLVGMYILALGKLQHSIPGRKPFVLIKDIDRIALIPDFKGEFSH